MTTIYFVSFLGDNALDFYRQVVAYLGDATSIPTQMINSLAPDEQDRQVNAGEIQAVFTCGLPYVRKADHQPPLLFLIAAPVMANPRYQNRPVYFSDVIVRADSPYESFNDLRGTTFAYNGIYSLSGYMLPCYHLLQWDEAEGFFSCTVHSGSHAASMDWVEQGLADAAAIDSVVLDMELTQHPQRTNIFRVVETIGPAPMPPLATSTKLAVETRQQIKQALLKMHTTKRGQAILNGSSVHRFAPVVDSDYDLIRQIIRTLTEAGRTELH